MAERRMFHISVVESDAFLDMPVSCQALYLHLCMHADDDGFVNGPKLIARSVGCCGEDLDRLVQDAFLIQFDDVVVIRHWRLANSLKNDRLKIPRFPEVAAQIYLREDRLYTTRKIRGGKSLWTLRKEMVKSFKNLEIFNGGFQSDSKRNPRRVEKNRTKPSIEEENLMELKVVESKGTEDGFPVESDPAGAAAAQTENCLTYMKGRLGKGVVLLTEAQIADLLERIGLDSFDHYVDKLSEFILKNQAKVRNHYATILKWWNEDRGVNYENQSFTDQPL